jgi:small-conductance mechanosensitive channel
LILSFAWLTIKAVSVLEDLILSRYDVEAKDNLTARKVYTQLNIFRKIVTLVVLILALAAILMSFEQVRKLGISILASAGVISVVIGFAAQKSIATLLAGIQIAITQPIRLDDVVIVENEWGWIEEITLTYVVVRVWDLRRLVLPITYFIEKPFQNWTRISADILGTVYLYADYSIPVQAVREELKRILTSSELWDRKVWGLQVTNATHHGIELRALMSSQNSSDSWNLRCEVREKLIQFIQENYPHALPKVRADIEGHRLGEPKRD